MTIAQSTTIQAYQLRKGGTFARMAILRMIAADSVRNFNPDTRLQPGDWRAARSWRLDTYSSAYSHGLSQGMNGRNPVWTTHGGEQFRNERDANKCVERYQANYGGWYTDSDCSETAIGIVAMLTHGRFIAGYRWTSNDERVYFGQVFDDESDAARMADEHARVFAESAREDSERFDKMTDAESEVELRVDELQEAIALRHRPKFGGFDRVRRCIEYVREARDTLADATRDYERGY